MGSPQASCARWPPPLLQFVILGSPQLPHGCSDPTWTSGSDTMRLSHPGGRSLTLLPAVVSAAAPCRHLRAPPPLRGGFWGDQKCHILSSPPAGDGISTVTALPPVVRRRRKAKSAAVVKVDDGAEQETVAVDVRGGYWEKFP